MAIKQNLEVANSMKSKVSEIKKYSTDFQKVKKLRNQNEKDRKIIKDNKNFMSKFYDKQVVANEKNSLILYYVIHFLLTAVACVVLYFLFSGLFDKLVAAKSGISIEMPQKASSAETIYFRLSLFALFALIGMLIYGIWMSMIQSDSKSEGVLTTIFIIGFLLKLANLILGIIIGVNIVGIDTIKSRYFEPVFWEFLKVVGIGIGIHVILFLLFVFINKNVIKRILDSSTLKKAKRTDERYFRINKEKIFKDIEDKCQTRQKEIDDIFAKYPYSKVKGQIDELEAISPIFCDFYEDKKVDGNDEIQIDDLKLNLFENRLTGAIEMIKSGRAETIKEALKELENDKANKEREELIRQQNAQLFELNQQLAKAEEDYYDYYDY